ncbi:uncharacterized protein G2W53_032550 [Senna tora]|uniref:Uncharacterized protein n=1 Tax=Senna tora TaxID=362788 RepID=A0A834T7Y7_9FABA|nr:uncharacterized protein G2W53_032550 [Senna tora]
MEDESTIYNGIESEGENRDEGDRIGIGKNGNLHVQKIGKANGNAAASITGNPLRR